MVGDYVKYNGVTKMVDAVYLYSVSVHDPSEEWSISEAKTYPVDDIEPIKLTDEILVKNGFEKVNEHYECIVYKQLAGDGFETQHIIIHSNNAVTIYTCIARILIHIDYVHQLQHLLRLCGIEKEITI